MNRRLQWLLLSALLLIGSHPSGAGAGQNTELSYIASLRDGFTSPTAMVVDTDCIALLEPYSRQLVTLTPDGGVVQRIDLEADPGSLVRLDESVYLLIDKSKKQVVAINLLDSGSEVFFAGGDPVDLIIDQEICYILDAAEPSIVMTDLSGQIIEEITLEANPALAWPTSMTRDRRRDLFHILDQRTARILTFSREGVFLGGYCAFGDTDGTVTRGGELACDQEGWVYLCDRFQGRVAVFDAEGDFALNIDPLSLDEEMLQTPTGIAIDDQGFIYVASTEGQCVQIFHLRKLPSSIANLLAQPLYPQDRDHVLLDGIGLVGGLAEPGYTDLVTGLDFRLMADGDSTDLLESINDLPLTTPREKTRALEPPVATWHPETLLSGDIKYCWQVRARGDSGTGPWSALFSFSGEAPAAVLQLGQNYPNPFNPLTTIPFSLPEGERATLEIYNLLGQLIWREELIGSSAGIQEIVWHGKDSGNNPVASGILFYRMRTAGFEQTRRLVLVR